MERVSRQGFVRDTTAAVAMAAFGAFGAVVQWRLAEGEDLDYALPSLTASILAVLAVSLPLAFRRVRPVVVLAAVTAAFMALRVSHVPEGTVSSVALFVAVYTVGAWEPDARWRNGSRAVAIVASIVLLIWSIFRNADYVDADGALLVTLNVSFNGVFFVVAWLMGDLSRRRMETEAELERRADQLAHEREERARRAVVDERVRIARELHDVVAHHVSVMGVQAGAARRVLPTDPERAGEALESIEESGRQAVSELQKLVGFLRSGDDVDSTGPQPTLDDLDTLVEQLDAAGLPVDVRVIGRTRTVPDSVSLSAYRVIQEALTNTLKHAGSVPTSVVLTFTQGSLDVEVVNRRGNAAAAPGGGRGLLGMRERAAMLGGTFTSGMTAEGGYRVAVSLPTGTAYDVEEAVR